MTKRATVSLVLLSLVIGSQFAHPRVLLALETGLSVVKNPEAPVENRFVVGPAKIEATVTAGDTQQVSVDLENRTGRTETFAVSFEDVVASADPNETVDLLGASTSQTSLKSDLSVPETSITLDQGDRVSIPVSIAIPANETPGGKFGSVVVSATVPPPANANGDVTSGAVVVGRVATLLFVTVPGDITHDAMFQSLHVARDTGVFFGTPVTLDVAYQNSGTTYENPYGGVTVRNMFGHVVETQAIDPWFVLPGSLRTREVVVATKGFFGRYTASVEMNRGYGDSVDTKEVSFFAFDPLTLLLLVLVIAGVLVLVRAKKVRS